MGDKAERLPALEQGFEHARSVGLARPLAQVLDEGAGPQTLPSPAALDREPPTAETPRSDTAPIPLRRRRRGP
jgi:hypothetical protein